MTPTTKIIYELGIIWLLISGMAVFVSATSIVIAAAISLLLWPTAKPPLKQNTDHPQKEI